MSPAAVFASRSSASNSCACAERRAAQLVAADRLLLLAERRAIPRLDEHADAPGDLVRASAHPRRLLGRPDPHGPIELRGVVDGDVVGAVLEPLQVPRRRIVAAAAGGPAEADLRPARHHDAPAHPREVAHRMEGHDRVVGARLHADVAARQQGVEVVARQRRDVGERRRTEARQPEAVVATSRTGPSPTVTVSRAAGRPTASPVSSGGAAGGPATAPTGLPFAMSAIAGRPRAQQFAKVGRVLRRRVERGEEQPVLHRGRDPGLVLAVEGDPRGKRRRRVALGGAADRDPAGHRAGGHARGAGRAQERPPADARSRAVAKARVRRCPSCPRVHDHGPHLRHRLGQRVHRLRQRADVLLGECCIAHVSAAGAVRRECLLHVLEAAPDLRDRAPGRCAPRAAGAPGTPRTSPGRSPRSPTGPCGSTGPPRRSPSTCDLVEQLGRAVRDLRRLQVDRLHQARRAWSTSATRRRATGAMPAVDPSSHRAFSMRWKPDPLGPRRHVVLAGVDVGVEVAERLRDGLDALVVRASLRVQAFARATCPAIDRVRELPGRDDQVAGLRLQVRAVVGDRLRRLRAQRGAALPGDVQRSLRRGAPRDTPACSRRASDRSRRSPRGRA